MFYLVIILKLLIHMLLDGATNLTNIVFPDSVKNIKEFAFTNSTIAKISFGSNITNISSNCNSNGNSISVSISEDNNYYKAINDIIYSKNGKKLICVMSLINGDFILDDSVEEICDNAFIGQRKMVSINLNIFLKKIGNNAFENCTSLERIGIPSSVEKIGNNAFTNTPKLKNIFINRKKYTIKGSPWGNQYGEKAISWST